MVKLTKKVTNTIVNNSIIKMFKVFKKINTKSHGFNKDYTFNSEGDIQSYFYNLLNQDSQGRLTELYNLKEKNGFNNFYDYLMHTEYGVNKKQIDIIIHNPESFEYNGELFILIEIKKNNYDKVLMKGKTNHSFIKDAIKLNNILSQRNQKGYCLIFNHDMDLKKSIKIKESQIKDELLKNNINTKKIRIYYFASFKDETHEFYRITKEKFIDLKYKLK